MELRFLALGTTNEEGTGPDGEGKEKKEKWRDTGSLGEQGNTLAAGYKEFLFLIPKFNFTLPQALQIIYEVSCGSLIAT